MAIVRMTVLGIVIAICALAAVVAPPAKAAEGTALCKVHQTPCESSNLIESLHAVAATTTLKTNLATVLCLSSLATASVEAPFSSKESQPLGAKLTALTWSNCGTNAAHNNCTVSTVKLPLVDITRTALNLGTAIVLSGQVHVDCGEIINCEYGGPEVKGFTVEGALHTGSAGHGKLTASELSVPKIAGGILCPATSLWTALFEPLEHAYLVAGPVLVEKPSEGTALCKVHQTPCESSNLIESIRTVAGTTVLKTNLATVLCLSSLATASVESPYSSKESQPLGATLTALTWSNCGTNALHNNCTVSTLKLPLADVTRTALNLGTAIFLNGEVSVVCTPEIISCTYGGPEKKGFTVEGALHTVAAGHGKLIANELSVPKIAGGFLCPATSKWTALFEPLEHAYLVAGPVLE